MVLHLQLFFCGERGTPCNFSFSFEFLLFTFIIYGYKKQCDVKKVGGGTPCPTPMIRVCAKFNTPKYNDLQSED